MAFQLGPEESQEETILAEINVTPLVDVMLVLLIIFMVTAPMLHQGIEVALPEAEADALELDVDDPLVLSINRDGIVYLKDQPIHESQLVDRLLPILEARGDGTVFLKGDRDLAYGTVVDLLDLLNQGGIRQVGMVTDRRRG